MGGGKNKSTTTTKMEPWGPAQAGLQTAIGAAGDLFKSGGFSADPYQGQRVAGFGQASQQGMDQIMRTAAGGTPGVDAAIGSLTGMMGNDNIYRDLDGVRNNLLGSAIPAATAQFSGSGMTNSSAAYDGVGRAASEALAPFEYDAYNTAQNRALSAAGMMPGLQQAQYLPGQMMSGVGQMQDANKQAQLTSDMQKYYETQGQGNANFQGYLNAMMGLGGLGGAQTGQQQQPGGGSVGGGILGGLGAYGALAMNPVTAPFAIGGGLLAGLGGMF